MYVPYDHVLLLHLLLFAFTSPICHTMDKSSIDLECSSMLVFMIGVEYFVEEKVIARVIQMMKDTPMLSVSLLNEGPFIYDK